MFNDYSLLKLAKQCQAELSRSGGTPGFKQERRKRGRGPARLILALLDRLRGAGAGYQLAHALKQQGQLLSASRLTTSKPARGCSLHYP